jgi:predicted Fe-Mo cluster-binding NifX family protein
MESEDFSMKIAVSVTGKNAEDVLDKRFGRCGYFSIIDLDTNQTKVIENNGAVSGSGAGIAAASQIIEEGVDIIVTGDLGPNAFELIEKAGIKAYRCDVIPISEVVAMFQQNKLKEISMAVNPQQKA